MTKNHLFSVFLSLVCLERLVEFTFLIKTILNFVTFCLIGFFSFKTTSSNPLTASSSMEVCGLCF